MSPWWNHPTQPEREYSRMITSCGNEAWPTSDCLTDRTTEDVSGECGGLVGRSVRWGSGKLTRKWNESPSVRRSLARLAATQLRLHQRAQPDEVWPMWPSPRGPRPSVSPPILFPSCLSAHPSFFHSHSETSEKRNQHATSLRGWQCFIVYSLNIPDTKSLCFIHFESW